MAKTMGREKLKVCWLSAGVSSFIAGYLANDVDNYIYIDIDDQHPDSMRFIKDCEKALGKPVEILKSPYRCVSDVMLTFRYANGVHGAKCTEILKKRVRKNWEREHRQYDITYIWGFDRDESHRAERLLEAMPDFHHEFPLIEKQLSKTDAHGILENLGIRRPKMYDLGYNNNNCIGCVKGGMGYWNKIRIDFPEVFKERAKVEREIGRSCIKGVFLDELTPDAGRMSQEVLPECDIMCHMAWMEADDAN